ncbi:MAG: tetratricopeptide repeat protein [Alphaproteobacteria bacterium]
MGAAPDIFVSFSSRDREAVRGFVERLREEGYTVWWDEALASRPPHLGEQIGAALEAVKLVIVVWSGEAGRSQWVYAEANTADAAGKVLHARIDGFAPGDIPPPFNVIHAPQIGSDFARILRDIPGVIDGTPPATRTPFTAQFSAQYGVPFLDTKIDHLPADQSTIAPSDLLKARFRAVAYQDATGMMADSLTWCRDGETALALRLIHGAGGLGKTRLMIDVAETLRAEGWSAGFLQAALLNVTALQTAFGDFGDAQAAERETDQRHRLYANALEQLLTAPGWRGHTDKGLLLVLDYAESQPEVVRLLGARLRRLGGEAPARPVRLICLSRGPDWWDRLCEEESSLRGLGRAGPGLARGPLPMQALPDEAGHRLALFQAARAAFAGPMAALGYGEASEDANPDLRDQIITQDQYARPLAVQMAALLDLAGAPPDEDADRSDTVIASVLALERQHWARVLGPLDGDRKRDLERGLAQVTLVGGVETAQDLRALLKRDRHDPDRATHDVKTDRPLADLQQLYGRGLYGGGLHGGGLGGALPLEPDLLGEHLVAGLGETLETALQGCFDWIEAKPEPERQPLLEDRLFPVLDRATAPVHGAVAGYLSLFSVETLAGLNQRLPHFHLALLDFALTVSRHRVSATRRRAGAGSDEAVAAAIGQLGLRLSALGRREEALTATLEAVDLYRALAEARPQAVLPDLATSLNNLGNRLSDLGRREEALTATLEAVEIRRALAEARPQAVLPDLATSLNNLSVMLSALGRREEALTATREAVDLYRGLAEARPQAVLPDLAMSLWVLSDNCLGHLGQHEDAAKAALEGLHAIVPFAEASPAVFGDRASGLARTYLEQCEKAGLKPDEALLIRIAAALGLDQQNDAD